MPQSSQGTAPSPPQTSLFPSLLLPHLLLPTTSSQTPSFPRVSLLPDHLKYLGGWVCAPSFHPSCQEEVGPAQMKLKIVLSTHV